VGEQLSCDKSTKRPRKGGQAAKAVGSEERLMPIDIDPVALGHKFNYLAKDGSEIYLLVNGTHGGLCQCILPEGAISKAVSHKTVEELWYVLTGEGEVWRSGLSDDVPVPVRAGTSLVIPPQTAFQFRNTGSGPLKLLITTMPPWPGEHEIRDEKNYW
jgi:mannose-6-phosphate isomerase-like protein (cupin superfamily)